MPRLPARPHASHPFTMLGQPLPQRGAVLPSTAPGGGTSRSNALIGTAPPAMSTGLQQLDQPALAHRWRISPRTLEGWRLRKQGPPFLKVGGKVLYRLTDIEAYEQAQLRRAGA